MHSDIELVGASLSRQECHRFHNALADTVSLARTSVSFVGLWPTSDVIYRLVGQWHIFSVLEYWTFRLWAAIFSNLPIN